jgi:hypothetical protein
MTKEEIIEMAEQAGFLFDRGSPIGFTHSMLKDFAKLVAEEERHQCARLCAEVGMWNLVHEIEGRGQE